MKVTWYLLDSGKLIEGPAPAGWQAASLDPTSEIWLDIENPQPRAAPHTPSASGASSPCARALSGLQERTGSAVFRFGGPARVPGGARSRSRRPQRT